MPALPQLPSLGDRVRYDGREHTVAALHGTSVRLVDDALAASVVLLGNLLAAEGFTVLSSAPSRPPLPDAGVLEGLPGDAVDRAEWWRRHLTELLTGRPDVDARTPVKAEYDPAVNSSRQRELASLGIGRLAQRVDEAVRHHEASLDGLVAIHPHDQFPPLLLRRILKRSPAHAR
ncbi:hypothetical protein [Streptomyces fradiae]|uniref:hypothetical protein n=1 Tax=Streptomyces fradiae TaxID=1906 RepID=UPI0037922217